ncbi:MAG: hypothetical protein II371_00065 [Flavobacteriales bacterium]|nr:hypothetical protein [Flavobacteriales bacterium]
MMKKYTFIILSSIATLFFSCDKAKVDEVWVKPPQLVQAYINPEIYGLGAEGADGGLFVLLPCNVGQYGVLRSNPKAYITNAANNRVYDSLRTVHNDRNDMAIRYVRYIPPLDMLGGFHYQVMWKEIERIDVKVDRAIGGGYEADSAINDIVTIQGLINMKEELSRSPQVEYFPDERYYEAMSLNQFNSRTRAMVALPLIFSIKDVDDIPVSECAFVIDVTFADGTTLTTSTGVVKL